MLFLFWLSQVQYYYIGTPLSIGLWLYLSHFVEKKKYKLPITTRLYALQAQRSGAQLFYC